MKKSMLMTLSINIGWKAKKLNAKVASKSLNKLYYGTNKVAKPRTLSTTCLGKKKKNNEAG